MGLRADYSGGCSAFGKVSDIAESTSERLSTGNIRVSTNISYAKHHPKYKLKSEKSPGA
jgi:hypothetical protein